MTAGPPPARRRAKTSADAPRVWQRMLSGRRLDLLDPSPLDVEVADIAHGLARVARWNGQTAGDHAFSVAQHSLIVEELVRLRFADPRWRLAALLHDAPEYVIGDMISPFKNVLGDGYRGIEARLQAAVHLRFSLPVRLPPEVAAAIKTADKVSAYFEAVLLAGFSEGEAAGFFGRPAGAPIAPARFRPRPASAVDAEFIGRFDEIDADLRGLDHRAG